MSTFRKINGVLCKYVNLLDSSVFTMKEVKDAIEAAEKMISPNIDITTSYEDTAELTIGAFVPATPEEVTVFDAAERDREERTDAAERKRFEELKARFEPSLRSTR